VLAGCFPGLSRPTPSVPPASPTTSAPTPHTPTPTPKPTPTPGPTPIPEEELAAACNGTPVPWAAPYAGKVHPLVVAGWGFDPIPDIYAINLKWLDGIWTSPIQLVLCPGSGRTVENVGSCGTYRICPDCTKGKLIRQRIKERIRVVVAKTGKTLQSKTLYGAVDDCPTTYAITLGDDPPWYIRGNDVTYAQISKYATAVSKQPVK
jgi:hypothetical protein